MADVRGARQLRRLETRRGAALIALTLVLIAVLPVRVAAQLASTAESEPEGSTGATVAGAALGGFSGLMLGTLGSLIPCSQTYAGAACVRVAAITGGTIGLAGGIYLGATSQDAIERAARGAAFGVLFGSAAGIGLKQFLPGLGWADVAALGLVGASIGASAGGAALGLAAGSVVGFGILAIDEGVGLPNAVSIGLLGAAAGGIGSWFARAVQESEDASLPPIAVAIPVGF